jgi:hypothetical protein
MINFNRAYWQLVLRMYGWGRTARPMGVGKQFADF